MPDRKALKAVWDKVNENPGKYPVATPKQLKELEKCYAEKQKNDKLFEELGKKCQDWGQPIEKWLEYSEQCDNRGLQLHYEAMKETLPPARILGTIAMLYDDEFNDRD